MAAKFRDFVLCKLTLGHGISRGKTKKSAARTGVLPGVFIAKMGNSWYAVGAASAARCCLYVQVVMLPYSTTEPFHGVTQV